MASNEVKNNFQQMYSRFGSVFDADIRGTFLNDISWFDDNPDFVLKNHTYTRMPSRLRSLFTAQLETTAPTQIMVQQSISRFGMTFATDHVSPGNSRVIVGSVSKWVASKIIEIFAAPSGSEGSLGIYLVVETYVQLTRDEEKRDPYKRYPYAGHLVYTQVKDTLVVSAESVLCHYASTPMFLTGFKGEVMHVLPLTRVRGFILYICDWELNRTSSESTYRFVNT